MAATDSTAVLDRLLDPVTRSLTPDALQELVGLRVDDDLQERLDDLADKNTEGQLTADERAEYEYYVHAIQVVGLLQAKARQLLAPRSAA